MPVLVDEASLSGNQDYVATKRKATEVGEVSSKVLKKNEGLVDSAERSENDNLNASKRKTEDVVRGINKASKCNEGQVASLKPPTSL